LPQIGPLEKRRFPESCESLPKSEYKILGSLFQAHVGRTRAQARDRLTVGTDRPLTRDSPSILLGEQDEGERVMGIGAQVGVEVASNLARGGMALHVGIQRAFDDARVRRERAVDSVQELALRLQEARRDQRAAERRAAAAAQDLGGALAELRQLREALRQERRLTAGLREAIGV
jgi:hypothetical protein